MLASANGRKEASAYIGSARRCGCGSDNLSCGDVGVGEVPIWPSNPRGLIRAGARLKCSLQYEPCPLQGPGKLSLVCPGRSQSRIPLLLPMEPDV